MGKNSKSYTGKKTLEVLEGANNYNKWIAESLLPFIQEPTLEIGAGIGNITKFFASKKPFLITDVDDEFVNILRKKFGHLQNISVKKLNIENSPPKNLTNTFKSIVAVNVLEHIKEDAKALKNCGKMLKKDGTLVLLVPAKKRAYSRLDKELGHFRRYEKRELVNTLIAAGFTIKHITYFNILGLVSWVVRDKVSKTHLHLEPSQVNLFDKIVLIAKRIEKYIPIPAGISLIAVAQKV